MNSIENILLRIEELRQNKRELIVAIDGRGGAGKSSLARQLVLALQEAVHIEYDWFLLPKCERTETARFDRRRLEREIISPFRARVDELNLHKFKWGLLDGESDVIDTVPTQITRKDILIIEGCETLHSDLLFHYDLRIWVETPPSECLRRGMKRDIDEYKLAPDWVQNVWKEWWEWQENMLKSQNLPSRADIIFEG